MFGRNKNAEALNNLAAQVSKLSHKQTNSFTLLGSKEASARIQAAEIEAAATNRLANAQEVQTDTELMAAGWQSGDLQIPMNVKIHGMWKEGPLSNWSYKQQIVTGAVVDIDITENYVPDAMAKVFSYYNQYAIAKSLPEELQRTAMMLIEYSRGYKLQVDHLPDIMANQVMMKGSIQGFWCDVERQIMFRTEAPTWWKLVEEK